MNMNTFGGGYGDVSTPPFAKKPIANGVTLIPASAIDPEPECNLWPGYLALGHITTLAGEFGANVDTLVALIVAIVSNGGTFPDGSIVPATNVFLLMGEHSLESSTARQLAVVGANTNNIVYIRGNDKDGQSRPLEIDKDHDFEKIKRKLSEINLAELDRGGLIVVSLADVSSKKTASEDV